MRTRRALRTFLAAAIFVLIIAAPATAKSVYEYEIQSLASSYSGAAESRIVVRRLDTALSRTVRITRSGSEIDRTNFSAGSTQIDTGFVEVVPGDVVEIYQPSIPGGNPMVPPGETFTLPDGEITSAPGATTLTGVAPSGAEAVVVSLSNTCMRPDDGDFPVTPVGNAFSTPLAFPLRAGARTGLYLFLGEGDSVTYFSRLAGESPCVRLDGVADALPPGHAPPAEPYEYYVGSLDPGVGDVRVVLSRGGTPYFDETHALSGTGTWIQSSQQPLPGDTVELYRPSGAASPTFTYQAPKVSAVFDPDNDLVAIAADALSSSRAVLHGPLIGSNQVRSRSETPAGRTVFDFSAPEGTELFAGVHDDSLVSVRAVDATDHIEIDTPAVRGDLLAPTVKAALGKSLKLKSVSKSIKLSLSSSEAAKVKVTVSLPKTLPSSKRPARKPGGKLLVMASRTVGLTGGKRTVKLTLTKRGRAAVKQLRGVGERLRAVPLTVKIVSEDAAGNRSTLTQKGRLAR